jgi:energy-coupling factor transporter ATP-binding protein EcfA2
MDTNEEYDDVQNEEEDDDDQIDIEAVVENIEALPEDRIMRFGPKIIEFILKQKEPSGNAIEDLKTAKDLVKKFLMKAKPSEVKESILLLTDKFDLKAPHVRILNDFYKEQKQEYDKKAKVEGAKETHFLDIDLDEEDISQEDKDAAREEALETLEKGDPMKYFIDTVQENHKGDADAIEAFGLAFAGQSTDVTDGLHIVMNGPSGSGKSHVTKCCVHLIPARWKHETSVSPKALFYSKIKPGMILFADDTDIPKDLEETVKRSVTNFQQETRHVTVFNGECLPLTIPPRIIWLFTNVESIGGAQLLNRQLTFNTENTEKVKDEALAKRLQDSEDGINRNIAVTHRVLVCRNIFGIIKDNFFKVKIPFAKRIKPKDNSDLRIVNKFLDMIVGYTIFNFMQRETDEEGFLLANEEDFEKAKRLFEAQKEGLVTKLNENERTILKLISQNENGLDLNAIASLTNIPYKTVQRIMNGRADRDDEGLLGKIKGLTLENMCGKNIYKLKNFNTLELYENGFISLSPE